MCSYRYVYVLFFNVSKYLEYIKFEDSSYVIYFLIRIFKFKCILWILGNWRISWLMVLNFGGNYESLLEFIVRGVSW